MWLRMGKRQQRLQWRLIAPVAARLLTFLIRLDLGLCAGTMEVYIRIQILAIESPDRLGMRGRDVAIAHMLADHSAILGFYQPVVVAVPRPRLGLFNQQFVQEPGHRMVDEFATVVGMKAANVERKLVQ